MTDGQEDTYINWFYYWTYNQSAITPKDRERYIKQYSKPGALRAGFEYYRAIFEDAQQNKEYAKEKLLDMPILTIGGEAGFGILGSNPLILGMFNEFCRSMYLIYVVNFLIVFLLF
jgi:hypothetical protein